MASRYYMPIQEAQDSSGGVLAGAKLQFYETGTTTPLDTYSNDGISSANANPVVADAAGRWGAIFLRDATYTVVLSDSDDTQIWSEDNVRGTNDNLIDDTIASTLSTAGSSNAYTLTVNRVITAYANGDEFVAKANFENTATATLNITGGQSGASALGAKTIKTNEGELAPGDILSGQWCHWKYDGTDMRLVSPISHRPGGKGGDIVSATTIVIDTDGSYFDITGNTGPIDTMTVAAGREFTLQFDSTPTFTDSATLDLGGADITAVAGDRIKFFATAANTVNLLSIHREGQSAEPGVLQFVSTTAITTVTEIDVTSFAAGYDYIITLEAINVTDDNQGLLMLFSDDNVNFEVDAGDYSWHVARHTPTETLWDESASDTEIQLTGGGGIGNDAGNIGTFEITLHNPMGTSEETTARWHGWSHDITSTPVINQYLGVAFFLQGSDNVQAVRFLWSGGSTFKAQGDITVWRRKRS